MNSRKQINRTIHKSNVLKSFAGGLLALLLLGSTSAHASWVLATVKAVYASGSNPGLPGPGLMVRLNITSGSFTEECTRRMDLFLEKTDPFYNDMLALLIASQLSGQQIEVSADGCAGTFLHLSEAGVGRWD